ncbi:MAG: prepilin peptidase [Alphaproteobacteria bacterium]|nr:prepilin peptidase [Alphaproteobacteria bacterium]
MIFPSHFATLGVAAAISVPAGWAGAILVRRETQTTQPLAAPMIAAAAVTFIWAATIVPVGYLLAATLLLGWTLLVLCAIDALSFRLPDLLTFPLTGSGLLLSFFLPDRDPVAHLIGAAAGFSVLYAVSWLYRQSRGHEGLGLGDAKLAAAAGAWLGWPPLPSVILIACLAGFVWVGVALAFRGKRALREQIAFGVPLCFAFWLVWLYGPPL